MTMTISRNYDKSVQEGSQRRIANSGSTTRKCRALLAVGIVGSILGLGVMSGAGVASATSLRAYPEMDCFATSTGGVIEAETLKVNTNSAYTVYVALVYRWTGAGWQSYGKARGSDGATANGFYDTVNGQLAEQPMSLAVPHGYYAVQYITESTGDNAAQYVWASVNRTQPANVFYSTAICRL
ncbi:MAG TPA: hypothetical protein VGO03_10600 [Acidimicrobiia bacterium]|jgi:hypothetical protein